MFGIVNKTAFLSENEKILAICSINFSVNSFVQGEPVATNDVVPFDL
mgnify:CR=1